MLILPVRVAIPLRGFSVSGPASVGDADGVGQRLFVVESGDVGVEGALLQLGDLALPLDEDDAVG